MDWKNPFTLLRDFTNKPATVSSDILKTGKLSDEEKDLIRRVGLTFSQLQSDIQQDLNVAWDRQRYTHQLNRSLEHPLIAAAMRHYAASATCLSPVHSASVWATSQSPKYQKVLSELLDNIGIEEKIYDWAWSVAAFGDLFVEINGKPSLGVVSIRDDRNPIEISRIEHEGTLIGFYLTPLAKSNSIYGSGQKIIEPWRFAHFRLLGAKRQRPSSGDPSASEFRTMNLMIGNNTRQATTRYGNSLIMDALPTYRRLRMAEDSLLLARMTRGILRYLYVLRVDANNSEMLGELIDQIANTLKRARAINTRDSEANFSSRENPMGVTNDLFLPLPNGGDDLEIKEIGGTPDIRWIVDIDELKQQLACALSTPLSLLGGYVDEASGALGSEAIEQLDIGFSRNSRRLQRSLINGIKRICQIHLAYQNMDPDPQMFEINMATPSRAEEKMLVENLDQGAQTIQTFMDMIESIDHSVDKKAIFKYLNQKLLKLEDFDLDDFQTGTAELGEKKEDKKEWKRYPIENSDLISYVPLQRKLVEGKAVRVLSERAETIFHNRWSEDWLHTYGEAKVVETKNGEEPDRQMTIADEIERKRDEDYMTVR